MALTRSIRYFGVTCKDKLYWLTYIKEVTEKAGKIADRQVAAKS